MPKVTRPMHRTLRLGVPACDALHEITDRTGWNVNLTINWLIVAAARGILYSKDHKKFRSHCRQLDRELTLGVPDLQR